MERLESEYLDADVLLRMEHRHRYMWAAGYACGDVCDLACGYGYGAEVLAANQLVNSYVGIDASEEAIVQANQRFAANARHYIVASATDIPLADHSIDTVVSLETLEHLLEPSLALIEFKRILRPDGVLVGSVPSKYFDEKAESVYGKNPYHVTRFTYAELVILLGKYFSTFRVYYSALEVVTRIGTLVDGHPTHVEMTAAIRNQAGDEVSGSFHFVASNRHWPDIDDCHQSKNYFCVGLTDLDALRVVPLRKLIEKNEQLVNLKDEHLRHAEELIRQKDERLRLAEEVILQRDQQFAASARTVVRRIRKYLGIAGKNQPPK